MSSDDPSEIVRVGILYWRCCGTSPSCDRRGRFIHASEKTVDRKRKGELHSDLQRRYVELGEKGALEGGQRRVSSS